MALYLYLHDRFIMLPYDCNDILNAFNTDIFEPFRLIENIVRKRIGKILDVKIYASYIDRKMNYVIEYIIRFEDNRSGETRI